MRWASRRWSAIFAAVAVVVLVGTLIGQRGSWLSPAAVAAGLTAFAVLIAGALGNLVANLITERVRERDQLKLLLRVRSGRFRKFYRVDEIEPTDLGVWPTDVSKFLDVSQQVADQTRRLPRYIPRDADQKWLEARKPGAFVVFVGPRYAGTTRSACHAISALPQSRRLVLPNHDDALAELRGKVRLPKRAVVYLGRLEPYLEDEGKRLNPETLSWLRKDGRTVVATLSQNAYDDCLANSHALGARSATVFLSDELSPDEMVRAEEIGGQDHMVRLALTYADGSRLPVFLASVGDLHERLLYGLNRVGVAVVRAGIDCRRMGIASPLAGELLYRLYPYYLSHQPNLQVALDRDGAFAWATQSVRGMALLTEMAIGMFDVAPCLIPTATTIVPDPVWAELLASGDLLQSVDYLAIGKTALEAQSFGWAEQAFEQAIARGDSATQAETHMYLGVLHEEKGNRTAAWGHYRRGYAAGYQLAPVLRREVGGR